MEDYIKCELIGGVSPRHLNTFSNLCIVSVHYAQTNTVPMYTMLSTPK